MCQHLSMFFVVEHVEPTNYIYIHYKLLQVLPRQKNIPDAKRDARRHQFLGKVSGDGNARLVLFAFIALFLTGIVYLNVESSVSRRILSSVYCGISRVHLWCFCCAWMLFDSCNFERFPYAPCMEYLPTFTLKITQM
jgi:hypothetical protein